jgi:hypothetical protein
MKILRAFSLALLAASVGAAQPALQPSPENPWYWSYHGQPVLLLGGTDDDNLFQWTEERLLPHLDRLVAAGGNVVRNTMSDRKDGGFEVYAYKQLPDGKYDLDQWNDEYWARFERLLREARQRHIIVQIEVWDRFDYSDDSGNERWRIHPYNPHNNINYSFEASGFETLYPYHAGQNRQPFFFTTPGQRNNKVVLPYQQRFVDKMLDHSLKYDNVLYSMDNETKADEEWGRYWARSIRDRAEEEGKQVFLTEMWDDWDITTDMHRRTYDYPELYGFVDVSQNNHNRGDEHWERFLAARRMLADRPRPMNTIKTYGATGNKFGHTDQDGIERFWRHLLGGAAAVRFHRPPSGLGLNDKAVACLRAARKLESKTPLWSLRAANELLSDRGENEAFLAADAGRAYALYMPSGGEVRVDLSKAAGALTVAWINVDSGEWGREVRIEPGDSVPLESPGDGNWAAAIVPAGEP